MEPFVKVNVDMDIPTVVLGLLNDGRTVIAVPGLLLYNIPPWTGSASGR
jgi:hypothetical protein